MLAGALPLNLAPGWKNVPPRATGNRLVYKHNGRWLCADTDFETPADLGPTSPVDCPVAYDSQREMIYRYHCAQWSDRRDVSELRQVRPDGSGNERLFALGLNKWALWLCEYLPERDSIAALVATEMPTRTDGTVVIQHQLGLFDVAGQRSLLVNLPRDSFYPLAIDGARERALFHGAEGYQVVDFSGQRQWKLGSRGLPEGRGGAFHPENPNQLALGGAGVMLIDRKGQFTVVCERGMNPVWSPDGDVLYYAESSSDLWRWSSARGSERLLTVAGNRYSEVNRARPVSVHPDGQMLAIALTRRIRRQVDGAVAGDSSSGWAEWGAVCILDLAERCVWQAPGGGPIRWIA